MPDGGTNSIEEDKRVLEKMAGQDVPSIDWLACFKCDEPFHANLTTKHFMGEVLYHYACPKCSLKSPTMSMVDLNDWWNIRKG